MKTLFVTGTDTGVGKTWIACLFVRHLLSLGIRTGAYKPVCSGAEVDSAGDMHWTDVDALRNACGTEQPLDLVCPQRFIAPVSPNVAAGLEGRTVNDHLLTAGIEQWRPLADWLVVEGAGGIYCPLSNQSSVMDLARRLSGPVIVVAANRLGVISHARLTIQALRSEGLSDIAVVLNDMMPPETCDTDPSLLTNSQQLRHWIPDLPLFHCAWRGTRLTPLTDFTTASGDFPRMIIPADPQKSAD